MNKKESLLSLLQESRHIIFFVKPFEKYTLLAVIDIKVQPFGMFAIQEKRKAV